MDGWMRTSIDEIRCLILSLDVPGVVVAVMLSLAVPTEANEGGERRTDETSF